jgi:ketol-acid reductoisomerase
MTALDPDAIGSLTLEGLRVAVLSYDSDARAHAIALRQSGNHVVIGVFPKTPAWWQASGDGFEVEHPAAAVATAEVVVVRSHEETAMWRQGAEHIAPGTLVVFACARALHFGRCASSGMDVVLVTDVEDPRIGCRIAVHRDVTRRALARAVAYARAVHGPAVPLRTTFVSDEVELEQLSAGDRAACCLALTAQQPARLAPLEHAPAWDADDEPAPTELDDAGWFYAMMNRRGTP